MRPWLLLLLIVTAVSSAAFAPVAYAADNSRQPLTANDLKCERGFHWQGDNCRKLHIPKHAELDFSGHRWVCERGFTRAEERCVTFTVPENAVLNAEGNGWECRLNFKRTASGCVAMTKQELGLQSLEIQRDRECGDSRRSEVTGHCGGEYVYGRVDACATNKRVAGQIVFNTGIESTVEGLWTNGRSIVGRDGNGNDCMLEIE